MFKKNPEPKASANIKSSERRKLLANICNIYNIPQEKLTKEAELAILPAVTKQATFKSPQGFSGTIYFNEDETPTWFKSRDSQVFPSVFTAWRAPFIVPRIKTHPHVIEILSGGADLMLPGSIPPFDSRATKGCVVGIVDSANPTVIKAIGRCKMNMTQFDYVIGKTGVAVEIFHSLDDELYKLNKFVDIPIPKELDINVPLVEEEEDNEERGDDSEETGSNITSENFEPEPEVDNSTKSKKEEISTESNDDLGETIQLTTDEVDNFFKRALFQSIQKDEIVLPMTLSNFMSNHVLKNLPAVHPDLCNIKKTSWKKSSKYLLAMEKEKYLSTKRQGKDDLVVESLIPKSHQLIATFVPHKTGSSAPKKVEKSNKKDKSNELSVVYLYKPTSNAKAFFNSMGSNVSAMYSPTQIRSLFENYVKLKDLANKKNPKQVVLDDTLNSMTKLGLGTYPRDNVYKAILSHLSPSYVILKPSETLESDGVKAVKGTPPKISIITEMKIGRKIVTRVGNFEHFHIKPHLLSDELKVKCSGSATTGPCVQNPSITEVTVQGPHGKLITELLTQKGIPISFIEFEDKVNRKKRK
ncbi:hypothetical protein CAAN4_B11694 [[Candida] anglica]|uniref:Translation machinery-associated protein 64 n=1 Tax=[Candida] anglica TaxID=148631 RepID=A0ABP0E826_9ASCO